MTAAARLRTQVGTVTSAATAAPGPGATGHWPPHAVVQADFHPLASSHNGKGLTEDAFDNATKVILNQDFVSGLTQPAKLLDYFPYLSAPPES